MSGHVNVRETERHPKYYIEGADLHIMVKAINFRVHSYFFARESTMFHRRFHPVTLGTPREGLTDKAPILLENISPEDFETFLWVFYNPRYSIYDTSVEKWKVILKLADSWGFREVKELAVRELHKKPQLKLVDRLALYQDHKVDPCHLIPLYALLCARDTPLSVDESKILGLETTVLIATMRERLRALPTNGGRSPLPDGLDLPDVFMALEKVLKLEEGAAARFYQDNGLPLPTTDTNVQEVPILNEPRNGRAQGGGGVPRSGRR